LTDLNRHGYWTCTVTAVELHCCSEFIGTRNPPREKEVPAFCLPCTPGRLVFCNCPPADAESVLNNRAYLALPRILVCASATSPPNFPPLSAAPVVENGSLPRELSRKKTVLSCPLYFFGTGSKWRI